MSQNLRGLIADDAIISPDPLRPFYQRMSVW